MRAGARPESGLGCLFQDGWRYHLRRIVMLRSRRFVSASGSFPRGFCRVGFECGEDEGGSALDDFQLSAIVRRCQNTDLCSRPMPFPLLRPMVGRLQRRLLRLRSRGPSWWLRCAVRQLCNIECASSCTSVGILRRRTDREAKRSCSVAHAQSRGNALLELKLDAWAMQVDRAVPGARLHFRSLSGKFG